MDVQNLMTREVYTVAEQTSLESARKLLHDKKVSGAPVLNDAGQPVGIIGLKNLADPGCPAEGVVADYMDGRVVTIDASATLREAAELMVRESLHRLIVVVDGKMVGILAALDVLPGLLRQFPDS